MNEYDQRSLLVIKAYLGKLELAIAHTRFHADNKGIVKSDCATALKLIDAIKERLNSLPLDRELVQKTPPKTFNNIPLE